MTIKTLIEIHPFTVPNFVRPIMPPGKRQEGWSEIRQIPLHELSDETLKALCDRFTRDVMEKAAEGRRTTKSESS